MARILTVAPEAARGPRRLLVRQARREYGVVPGMMRVLLPDLQLAAAAYPATHRVRPQGREPTRVRIAPPKEATVIVVRHTFQSGSTRASGARC